MLIKEKMLNYKSYSDPFPVIEISNFLDEHECRAASDVLKNTEFDILG